MASSPGTMKGSEITSFSPSADQLEGVIAAQISSRITIHLAFENFPKLVTALISPQYLPFAFMGLCNMVAKTGSQRREGTK